jgi:hypothetical protein
MKMSNEFYYIPKLRDGKVTEMGVKLHYAMVDAPTIKSYPGVLTQIQSVCDVLWIDPASVRIQYPNSHSEGLKNLAYYQDAAGLDKLYGDSSYRLNKFVIPAINFQIENGASPIIVPYLYSDDFISKPSNTNFSMINDAIIHKEHGHISNELYVHIQLPITVLTNTTQLNYMFNKYAENSNGKVTGVIISVNNLDDRKADITQLKGLIHIIRLFSEENYEVYLNYSGSFGYVLSTVGLTGYISGLNQTDSYSTRNFEMPMKGANKRLKWTYITELLSYLNDSDIKKIGYTCDCPACSGGYPNSWFAHKAHFLQMKLAESSELNGKSITDKITKVRETLEFAKKYSNNLEVAKAVKSKAYHLDRWLTLVEYIDKLKPFAETDAKLEGILEILEREK